MLIVLLDSYACESTSYADVANDSMDRARRTMSESIRSFNKFDTMGSKGEYNPFKENIENTH